MIMGRFTGLNPTVMKMLVERIHGKPITINKFGVGAYSFEVEDREFIIMNDLTDDQCLAHSLNILIYLVERFLGRAIGDELPKSLATFLFDSEFDVSTLESDVVKSLKIIAKAVDERMSKFKGETHIKHQYAPISIYEDLSANNGDRLIVPPTQTNLVEIRYRVGSELYSKYANVYRPNLKEFEHCEAKDLEAYLESIKMLIEIFCACLEAQLFKIGAYSATRHKKPIE